MDPPRHMRKLDCTLSLTSHHSVSLSSLSPFKPARSCSARRIACTFHAPVGPADCTPFGASMVPSPVASVPAAARSTGVCRSSSVCTKREPVDESEASRDTPDLSRLIARRKSFDVTRRWPTAGGAVTGSRRGS